MYGSNVPQLSLLGINVNHDIVCPLYLSLSLQQCDDTEVVYPAMTLEA